MAARRSQLNERIKAYITVNIITSEILWETFYQLCGYGGCKKDSQRRDKSLPRRTQQTSEILS